MTELSVDNPGVRLPPPLLHVIALVIGLLLDRWRPWRLVGMYLGLAGAYAGGALLVDSVWPLLLRPVVLGLPQVLIIGREERYLASAFGTEYAAYKRRVRRWR